MNGAPLLRGDDDAVPPGANWPAIGAVAWLVCFWINTAGGLIHACS